MPRCPALTYPVEITGRVVQRADSAPVRPRGRRGLPAVTLAESILIKDLGETHGPLHQLADEVRIHLGGIPPQFSGDRFR